MENPPFIDVPIKNTSIYGSFPMAMVLGNANNAMMLMMATMMVRIGEVGLKFCPVSILPRPWQWCRCRTWSHLSFPPWCPFLNQFTDTSSIYPPDRDGNTPQAEQLTMTNSLE